MSFCDQKYGKFAVITRSRTGSNLLISLLDSHEEIVAHGEKFQRLGDKNSSQIYNQIFPVHSNKVIGFKIFYYHPLDSNDKSIWEQLQNDRQFKIIHLLRNNLLRVHISRLIAEKTDNWSSRCIAGPENNKMVYIDMKKFLGDIANTKNHIEWTRKVFKNHKYLEVTYENLTYTQETTITDILQFLEVPEADLKSPYKKQNPEKIQHLVSNYDELYNTLITTEHSFMLEEEQGVRQKTSSTET